MYFAHDNVLIEKQEAFLYAGGVVLCSAISVLTAHRYGLGLTHIGMKLRVSCCSLIYRKARCLFSLSLYIYNFFNRLSLTFNFSLLANKNLLYKLKI